jgi:hypothetical protein
MAWFSKPFIFTVLSVLLIHCQSPEGEITDAFKKVNGSIEKTNKSIIDANSIEYLYSTIRLNQQKNAPLAEKAGRLYAITKDAHAYLERLKEHMEKNDSSGVNAGFVASLLIGTPVADTLTQKLSAVYDHSYAALNDQNKTKSLDSTLVTLKEIRSNKQWTTKYFDNTLTIAAITILSKFQYDCLDAARLVLGDIKQQLDN